MKQKTLIILSILLILIIIPLFQPKQTEKSSNIDNSTIPEEEYYDINHHQSHHQKNLKSLDLNDFHPTFKPACLETKNYTSFPLTSQSILSKQFEVPKLSFPLDKIPPNSLDQQKCFGKQVIACPVSNYQQCTNNYPLNKYTSYDLCNCNGYSVTNLCPYQIKKQAQDVNIKLNCPLTYNQYPFKLVLP